MTVLESFNLAGRQAIVTGGAGHLGRNFARALAEAGSKVHLLDLSKEALEDALNIMPPSLLTQMYGHTCDITKDTDVRRCLTEIKKGGEVNILINSAAVDPKFEPGHEATTINGSFTDYSLENWSRSLEVNLTGTFLMTREAAKVMEAQAGGQGSGSIICISSTYGLTGPDQRLYQTADGKQQFFKPVDYSTTKAGVLGFVKAVAAYYRGTGIRVNALSPGGTLNSHDPHFVASYAARTISNRMAEPTDYAGAIVYLSSDASSYVTGANFVVDGGWTAL